MDAVLMGLKQAFQFQGRTSRADYAIFIIACWLFMPACARVSDFATHLLDDQGAHTQIIQLGLTAVYLLISLFVLIATISASIRRCHDCGWSGWAALLLLIPFIGIAVLFFMKGDPDENRFGKVGFMPWAN
ncbi:MULTISPECIES: DUF805 domain-containing protein [Asaia]|uniref:DUF805 domain-containing protein n=1 Tax=Asaia spathodeae TaxID=657016 RepID=A0ABX2P764_9PROT|nr:DUF805 domain-containing protein [Asaia spathodeae]GBR16065.1 putative membrane protein [Asaia spathodeae NBRC 105894]